MKAIVLILRGCPVGWLGAYGNEWVVTPHLDRLASESVVFDRHISNCPEPAAAGRAWLAENASLLPTLRASGIRTVLLRANHPDNDAPDWYYAGWGEVFDARPQQEHKSPLDELIRVLPSVLTRLESVDSFLLWIEIDRLIPPWDVPQEVFNAYLEHEADEDAPKEDSSEDGDAAAEAEPVTPWRDPPTGPFDRNDPAAREWLATSFGSVITMLDTELGAVFDQFRSHRLDQSAAWFITSDFGYPLGEHGQIGLHRPWLYEELVHLPLILRLPGSAEGGRRVGAFTQPPDIPIALLNHFGLNASDQMSLLSLAHGATESLRSQAITSLELGGAAERAIRTEGWAYLFPVHVPDGERREPQLFQKPDDRWEVNDLRARYLEQADELEAMLKGG